MDCKECEQMVGLCGKHCDPVESARIAKDQAIVRLWLALRDLSDNGEDALTEQDLQLWGYVTGHDAVQTRVNGG